MPANIDYDAAFFSTNTTEKLHNLVKELTSREGNKANKALNYYDGKQEEELIRFFNLHRQDWENDHLIPRCRNITKMVVEKSGQIIHDTPPIFAVHTGDDVNPIETEKLIDALDKADSIETWINLDEMVRLLKTIVVLVSWSDQEQQLVYDLLHRGNSLVKWDTVTKVPQLLLYNLFSHETFASYRLIVSDLVIDFNFEFGIGKVTVTMQDENPLGIVPAAQFYDTTAPRVGFWNTVPLDLINVNEMYNVGMSDSEYAMNWMKRPTLFTNAMLADSHMETSSPYNNTQASETRLSRTAKFPHQSIQNSEQVKFGPSRAIQLDTGGVDSPFADFKAPVVSLKPIDEVMNGWVEAVASDWSVRAKVGGTGSAASGFQLVVEELPNLELRKQRQKMFAIGLSRLFDVIKTVLNTVTNISIAEEATLVVTYKDPTLPVENEKEEALWTVRINEGRATLADYFIETKGMSPEEAINKIKEIIELNRAIADVTADGFATPIVETNDQQEEDEDA